MANCAIYTGNIKVAISVTEMPHCATNHPRKHSYKTELHCIFFIAQRAFSLLVLSKPDFGYSFGKTAVLWKRKKQGMKKFCVISTGKFAWPS